MQKIKKINNGLGVELQPDLKPKDTEMEMYTKYLNRIFISANKKDAYLRHKHSNFKI